MLNKKGSSLVELVISIALMSIVLVFMMKLLVDLNNTETNNSYANKNEIIRSEIIKMINNDLNSNDLKSISDTSTDNELILTFSFNNNTSSKLNVKSDTITYKTSDNNTRKWTLKESQAYPKCAKVTKSIDDNIYVFEIDIEIHTNNDLNNELNNNILDDILISYVNETLSLDNTFKNTLNTLDGFGKLCK